MALPHEKPLEKWDFEETIGGALGKHTLSGPKADPPDGWKGTDYDYEASNYDELVSAVGDAGARVHIADHITVPRDASTERMGHGTIVEGDYCNPDVPSVGNWIHLPENDDDAYPRKMFKHSGGEPPKLYGVYALGPKLKYFDPDHTTDHFKELTTSFLHEYSKKDDGLFRVAGSRFSGWTLAGLEIGAKNYRTKYEVHRSTFNMNPMEHLGYGGELYRGDGWFDRCYFNKDRHGFAGYGYGDQTIDVTNSVFGPGWWAGHAADMHGLANNTSTDSNVAGKHLRLRNCSFLFTKDIDGSDQEGVVIRGVSEGESRVYKSEFAHPEPTDPPGEQGDPIRQESGTNSFENLRVYDNTYGEIGEKQGIGAPKRSAGKEKPGNDNGSGAVTKPPNGEPNVSEPVQTLSITGQGNGGCDYFFALDRPVRRGPKAEKSDVIKQRDTEYVIEGHANNGGTDDFELDAGAEFESAWFDGGAVVLLDGEPMQLGPLVATEAQRRT